MRRFFCQELAAAGAQVTLCPAESRHLSQVLRGRVGDSILLLDGKGKLAEASISHIDKRAVRCEVRRLETLPAPRPELSIFVAPPRGKAMGRLVRQATELGAARIVPILCARSVARPDAANWDGEAREACKQSANPYCPAIESPHSLSDALQRWPLPGYVATVPRQATSSPPTPAHECGLWVGPEGGFTDAEQEQLLAAGLHPLVIGPWVLRVETALVACAAWIRSSAGVPTSVQTSDRPRN